MERFLDEISDCHMSESACFCLFVCFIQTVFVWGLYDTKFFKAIFRLPKKISFLNEEKTA